jgi:hypothetical protein
MTIVESNSLTAVDDREVDDAAHIDGQNDPLATYDLKGDLSFVENYDIVGDAERVVSGLRSGVRAVIDACVLTATTCGRFPRSIDAFMDVLVDGNIISREERKLGTASPKLSKLRTIGNHAALLNRHDIFPHLVTGFTLLHQLLVLYKNVEGDDEDARVSKLLDIIKVQPTLSMDFLKRQTEIAKERRKSKEAATSKPAGNHGTERDAVATDSTAANDHDLILLTPSHRDIRKLRDDYFEEGDHPRCLRVHEQANGDAVAIVIARIVDFPIIATRLLPFCGFDGPMKVICLREDVNRDITDAEVLIIAERGRMRLEMPANFAWPTEGEPIDAASIAARLFPDAASRLHVFAPRETEGWTSVSETASWERADD